MRTPFLDAEGNVAKYSTGVPMRTPFLDTQGIVLPHLDSLEGPMVATEPGYGPSELAFALRCKIASHHPILALRNVLAPSGAETCASPLCHEPHLTRSLSIQ